MPIASASALTKTYPGGITALAGVDLELEAGSLMALVGANASGKSTLLALLAGRLRPSSGSVTVLGADPARASRRLRAQLSHVPQDVALDPEMTGAETLDLFAVLHGLAQREWPRRLAELVASHGLAEHLDRRVASYSGGLRRRLHLALGLLPDARLLILDEPTAGLDPTARELAWRRLAALAGEGRSVVVASHDLAEIERHAGRVAILERGQIVARGSPDELAARHAAPRLTLSLAAAPAEPAELERSIAVLDGVNNIRWANGDLVVETAPGAALERSLLELVQGRGLVVERLEVHAPDLAGAFLALTGRPLEAAARPARRPPTARAGRPEEG